MKTYINFFVKKIFLILILLINNYLNAQIVTISDELEVQNGDTYDIVGKMGNQVLLLTTRNQVVEVQVFDEEMRLRTSKTLEFEKKDTDILAVLWTPDAADKFSLVYRYRRKSETHFRVRKYNDKIELIDSAAVKVHKQWDYAPFPRVAVSEDKTKFVLHYIHQNTDLTAVSFDLNNMNVLWEQTTSLRNVYFDRDGLQTLATNSGDFYYILQREASVFSSKKADLTILKFNTNLTQQLISLNGNAVHDVYFKFDNQNQRLLAVGLYDSRRTGRVRGYLYLNVSSETTSTDYTLTFAPFSLEVLSTIMGKQAKEGDSFSDAFLNEPVIRNDGGIVMTIERKKIVTSGDTPPPSSLGSPIFRPSRVVNIQTDYYYDDVIVVNLNPDGSEYWSKVLYKRQQSQDDQGVYSSYFLLQHETNMHFLFNDMIRSNTTVSQYSVNPLGGIQRQTVFNTEGKKIDLTFINAMQIAYNEVIVPSHYRRWFRLVRLRW